MLSFKRGTAIGNDHWPFRLMALLPDEALNTLGSLLTAIKDWLAPPLQTLCNNLARLPKKTGGDRTIAIATSIYRLLMTLDHDRIDTYSQSHAYCRDSARKGQSALSSAEDRAFDAEVAVLSGQITHQILWDVDFFFDSIDIPTLISITKHFHFPMWELALTLLVHQAPRRIINRDAVGAPVIGLGRSILAGCKRSTYLARLYLSGVVDSMTALHPDTALYLHVDDMSNLLILSLIHI